MKVLILDNGHGKNTPGKCSPDKRILEYEWARDMVRRIAEKACLAGIHTEIVVPEESDIPLKERVRRVNALCAKYGPQNCALISVHINAAGNGTWMNARGWSAFTSKGWTRADILANFLYAEAESRLAGLKIRKDMSDGDPDWEEGFYILRKTVCPAVLTENFFQDNRDDVEYLISESGKEAIATLHIDAIKKYFENN